MISSARTRLAKIGPGRYARSLPPCAFVTTRLVPITSLGIRSGVNWMREKLPPVSRARVRTIWVFPRPGAPSSSTLPPARSAPTTPRITSSWPKITAARPPVRRWPRARARASARSASSAPISFAGRAAATWDPFNIRWLLLTSGPAESTGSSGAPRPSWAAGMRSSAIPLLRGGVVRGEDLAGTPRAARRPGPEAVDGLHGALALAHLGRAPAASPRAPADPASPGGDPGMCGPRPGPGIPLGRRRAHRGRGGAMIAARSAPAPPPSPFPALFRRSPSPAPVHPLLALSRREPSRPEQGHLEELAPAPPIAPASRRRPWPAPRPPRAAAPSPPPAPRPAPSAAAAAARSPRRSASAARARSRAACEAPELPLSAAASRRASSLARSSRSSTRARPPPSPSRRRPPARSHLLGEEPHRRLGARRGRPRRRARPRRAALPRRRLEAPPPIFRSAAPIPSARRRPAFRPRLARTSSSFPRARPCDPRASPRAPPRGARLGDRRPPLAASVLPALAPRRRRDRGEPPAPSASATLAKRLRRPRRGPMRPPSRPPSAARGAPARARDRSSPPRSPASPRGRSPPPVAPSRPQRRQGESSPRPGSPATAAPSPPPRQEGLRILPPIPRSEREPARHHLGRSS